MLMLVGAGHSLYDAGVLAALLFKASWFFHNMSGFDFVIPKDFVEDVARCRRLQSMQVVF